MTDRNEIINRIREGLGSEGNREMAISMLRELMARDGVRFDAEYGFEFAPAEILGPIWEDALADVIVTTPCLISVQVIWDRDHGTENEGWYIRRTYSDGRIEDENPGDTGYSLEDSDADVIAALVPDGEQGIAQVRR